MSLLNEQNDTILALFLLFNFLNKKKLKKLLLKKKKKKKKTKVEERKTHTLPFHVRIIKTHIIY